MIDHPSWCYRVDCSVDESGKGWHHSRPIVVDGNGIEFRVRVVRASCPDRTCGPLIDLDRCMPGFDADAAETDAAIAIEPQYALALGHALLSAGRVAQSSDDRRT